MAVRAKFAAEESRLQAMNANPRYVIEPAASQFTARVFAGGLLSAFGHSPTIAIPDFSGEAEVNSDDLEQSSLKLTIQTASLTVKDDISGKDRREMERAMHEEVLESSEYPEIVYECSHLAAATGADGQYSIILNGALTMHGVTRSQPVSARVVLNGDSLRAFGNFSVMQSDYRLKLASAAGGALKVKDEIKCSFNISSRKID